MKVDCVTFLSFYLGEELTLEVPTFHEEIWGELVDMVQKVSEPGFIVGHLHKLFAVPREHAKSTLIKLAVILFMRYSPLAFTLYVSKTNTVAMNALKDVVKWFKSPQEVDLYGEPIVEKANETESIWILLIGLPSGHKKRIILKAIGQGQQVRGTLIDNKRPELILLDDIEDLDTADGGVQQSKLDEWTLGSLLKATARRSVRIFIGNMVRSTTLLARLAKESEWNPTVFGALVRDKATQELKALWDGRWTVKDLLEDYRKYRRIGMGHVWESEMMNLSQDVLLTQSLSGITLFPDPNPEDITAGFLALDPAFGQEAWHDNSAISAHVRVKGIDLPIQVASVEGRWTEGQVLDELLNLSYYWNIRTWVIESVAAQKLLLSLFRLLLIERQIKPEVFLMLPVLAGKESKASRIVAYRQAVGAGSYLLSESQIDVKLRLEEYSPDTKDHDDLCDSSAYGPIIWGLYGKQIVADGITSVAGLLMQDQSIQSTSQGELDVCPF